jgi:signal transduction histidine kinase
MNNRDKKIADGGLTDEPSLKKTMYENIPRIIIIGTTAAIIITALLISFSSDPLEKRIKDLVTSIASLASAAFISVFSYHYQSKGQHNRDQITNEINTITREINTITKEQDRRNRSFLNRPLILISSEISKLNKILENDDDAKKIRNLSYIHDNNGQQETLQHFQNKNRQTFKEGINNIHKKSLDIRTFIGDIYEDISVSAQYFEDTVNNQQPDIKSWINASKKAIHEADIARDHIELFFIHSI